MNTIANYLATCALLWTTAAAATSPPESTDAAFQRLCAQCHGADRLGGIGPALIPETMGRLKPDAARRTILEGRVASQMPAFAG